MTLEKMLVPRSFGHDTTTLEDKDYEIYGYLGEDLRQ